MNCTNKKAYCEYCEEDIIPIRTVEEVQASINKVEFKFNKIINRCPNCGREVYIEEDNKENVKIAHEKYALRQKESLEGYLRENYNKNIIIKIL